jgi:hypothetical protein
MNIWVVIGLVAVGVIILLLLVAAQPQRKPHHLTKEEVADEIEAFLNGAGGAFNWDDFCTFTLSDPELDKIRARCAQLDKEFPPDVSGRYCNEEGLKVLSGYVEYLRRTDA